MSFAWSLCQTKNSRTLSSVVGARRWLRPTCLCPTTADIEAKKADITAALQYDYNEKDIEEIIANKSKFCKNPTNYAMQKNQLLQQLEVAEGKNDFS